MPIPILIAYATRSGSTREVASAVGAALREAGLDVEVLPVDQVSSLDGKTAVLLGAPLEAFVAGLDAVVAPAPAAGLADKAHRLARELDGALAQKAAERKEVEPPVIIVIDRPPEPPRHDPPVDPHFTGEDVAHQSVFGVDPQFGLGFLVERFGELCVVGLGQAQLVNVHHCRGKRKHDPATLEFALVEQVADGQAEKIEP